MEKLKFYIDGAWVDPATPSKLGIVNPATEEVFAQIILGSRPGVDRAAKAARRAFASYSVASVEARLSWLHKIIEGFRARLPDLARMMTLEMGAPITFATERQATVALFHFEEAARVLANYKFEERMGNGIVRRDPGRSGLLRQRRPKLPVSDAHAYPSRAAGRGFRGGARGCRHHSPRRPARSGVHHGAAGEPGAVSESAGSHPVRR